MTVEKGTFMTEERFATKRTPSYPKTATKAAAVNATQESWAVLTDLNVALAAAGKDPIPVRAMRLDGVFLINNKDGAAHDFYWQDGGGADGGDAQMKYTTAAGIAVYPVDATVITDATGNIEIKVDVVLQCDVKFVCRAYQEVQTAAE